MHMQASRPESTGAEEALPNGLLISFLDVSKLGTPQSSQELDDYADHCILIESYI